MHKRYKLFCIVALLALVLTSCSFSKEQGTTIVPTSDKMSEATDGLVVFSNESSSIVDTAPRVEALWGFVIQNEGEVYVCKKNTVNILKGNKTTKTLYESDQLIGGVTIFEQKMYVELIEETDPPQCTYIEVDLKTGVTKNFFTNSDKRMGMPNIINGDFYYTSSDNVLDSNFDIIKRRDDKETIVLNDICYYSFYNSRIYYLLESDRNIIFSSNLDGKDNQKELVLKKDLNAFEINNDRIYFDVCYEEFDIVFVHEISTKKTVDLGSEFYHSSLFFNDEFAFATENETDDLLKINTTDYSTTKIKQKMEFQNYCIIDDWIYAQNVIGDYGETREVNLYRMRLDGTSLEKIT